MKLEEAEILADRIVDCIKHLCDPGKIVVVGSIRRKRATVHDIDIVLIPQQWMWNSIIHRLRRLTLAGIVKAGPKLATLKVPTGTTSETFSVDIYKATPQTWGVLLLIRTGSTQHNITLCSRAQRMGMMLSAKDGVIKDGKVIACRSEEEIFKALKMDFVAPEEREV